MHQLEPDEASSSHKKERKKLKLQQQQQQKLQMPKKNSKECGKMLESFWKLSEYDANTRCDGIRGLIKYFFAQDAEEAHTDVLNRLIKGLAFDRKCSRLGYSTCLTELINSTPIRIEQIFEMARAHLVIIDATKEIGKNLGDVMNVQIGRLFVYLAYIQSERFGSEKNESLLQTITEELNSIRKRNELKVDLFFFFCSVK